MGWSLLLVLLLAFWALCACIAAVERRALRRAMRIRDGRAVRREDKP